MTVTVPSPGYVLCVLWGPVHRVAPLQVRGNAGNEARGAQVQRMAREYWLVGWWLWQWITDGSEVHARHCGRNSQWKVVTSFHYRDEHTANDEF